MAKARRGPRHTAGGHLWSGGQAKGSGGNPGGLILCNVCKNRISRKKWKRHKAAHRRFND